MQTQSVIPTHVPPERVFAFDIYKDSRITQDVQGSLNQALNGAPDIFYTPYNGGHWIARGMANIAAIGREPEIFSNREQIIPRVENPPFFIPLSLDPPANVPYRRILMPKFSPQAVEQLEPKLRQWAVKIVESVAGKGRCDFIADVSGQFPISVFMELMGLPLDRLGEFRDLVNLYFNNQHTPEGIELYGGQIIAHMRDLIALRRKEPKEDLVSFLVHTPIEGRATTQEELEAMCFIIFLGGMDTVTNVMGFTYQRLAVEPALQQRLREHPEDIPAFVEEGVRCFGVATQPRLITRDCERFGVQFREGEMMLGLLPISGRDGSVHKDPNAFDIDRPDKHLHYTFSTGPHLCLGHILARAEIRILTEEWVKRIPSFRATPGKPHPFRVGTLLALESLPLEWDVAAT